MYVLTKAQTFLAILTTVFLPPTLLFTTFVTSIFLLSLGAALLFTLFWTGVALLLLVPTLFVASGLAIFAWAWTVTSFIIARSIARLLGWDLAPNGQIRRERSHVGPLGGVDGKVSGAIEFDGKRLNITGNVDGKAEEGAAYKKEEEVDNYPPSTAGQTPVDNQRPAIDSRPVWAPGTDIAAVVQAPVRVQTPGGS